LIGAGASVAVPSTPTGDRWDRAGELARARCGSGVTGDTDCRIWFGVGEATISRIEAGEIIPEDEIAAKIDRFLCVCDGSLVADPSSPTLAGVPVAGPSSPTLAGCELPTPPETHSGGNPAGEATASVSPVFSRGAPTQPTGARG